MNDRPLRRFDVYLVEMAPCVGNEVQKMRPAVIISPESTNKQLKIVTIVPMSSKIKSYPTRLTVEWNGKQGQLMIEQIKTVDLSRLVKYYGQLAPQYYTKLEEALVRFLTRQKKDPSKRRS